MNIRIQKMLRSFVCVLGAAILAIAAVPVSRANAVSLEPGKNYGVHVVPVYQNPDNGSIDDSGKNPALGQMMVEAQVQNIGYLEIKDDGSIFLHTRWNQPDPDVSTTRFETSSDGSASFQSRSFTVTGQYAAGEYEFMDQVFSASITDYCIRLDSPNDTIRCTYYVKAMQRECIWYCYISSITGEGIPGGWYDPHIPNMTPEPLPTQPPETQAPETKPTEPKPTEPKATEPKPTEPAETTAPTEPQESTAVTVPNLVDRDVVEPTQLTLPTEKPGEVQGIVGLDDETQPTEAEKAPEASAGPLVYVGLGLVAAAVIAVSVYFCIVRKKKKNKDLFSDVDE